ncbi:alpha/beta hydrolase [Paraburkholderia fungorum]|uniref:alpha/beta hydrolase n=1 Tax=Paraburkholderia fungorum TaxID=134537 RepID=UPI0038BD16D9
MISLNTSGLDVEDLAIRGHGGPITLRSYRLSGSGSQKPVVLYFHGGAFRSGCLEDADAPAVTIARSTPAWVVSVGYSLAPAKPFPHAPEDGYRALLWAAAHARKFAADASRVGLAGHDAGGNLATCIAAMARDRGNVCIGAQVLLAPLLDPGLTWVSEERHGPTPAELNLWSSGYRAYLPGPMQHLHPYAAPLESSRLAGLPPAFIALAGRDPLRREAQCYANRLKGAGVLAEEVSYAEVSHAGLANNVGVLADVAAFFAKHLESHALTRRKAA